ncbi:regulator of G-protein signaling 8-like isoform X2 [Cottoperca gobio]|uniref:Regulator of G-protein signaling 8-like isoform X2 n=1 Tax=Cottoperca gobio TaxID=56716 RepID=A0A6J2PK64_COTGO|nr:regulator of G-protein signaling 8-like isoform X2 [Cottoperca gobio]
MPSLIVEPLNTQHFIMDRDDRKRNKNMDAFMYFLSLHSGKNFMCRLQCMFSHSSSSERLSLEDTQQWSQSLERLLESKYGLATFRNFLKSEYSDENIEFWLTCEDYKKIKSSFRMSSRAKKIYEQYIKAESPKEINIDYHTREQIKRNVKTPTMHCFDDAQKMVYGLMERDSYPRFLRSDIYRTLLENLAADATKG